MIVQEFSSLGGGLRSPSALVLTIVLQSYNNTNIWCTVFEEFVLCVHV